MCISVNNTTISKKRCLIKDDSNYMFRPIAAIIMFSFESMVVVLYMIGIVMSWWWDLSICDVCYMLLLRGTGGGYVMCVILVVEHKYVCSLLSYVGLQLLFVHFRCLLLVGFCYGPCVINWYTQLFFIYRQMGWLILELAFTLLGCYGPENGSIIVLRNIEGYLPMNTA